MSEQNGKLKSMLLDMFSWFHDFCICNGLQYYALGGTMLGAARHQGFIPWDDDIDVGMPRRDYLRFAALMQAHPQGCYILETPHSENADFFYPISKLYDTRTTLMENTRYKIKRGIYLDIFPLDGAGDSEEEARTYFSAIKGRRNLLLALTTGVRKGRSLYKNMAVLAMRPVPDWVIGKKKLLRSIDIISGSRAFEDCAWVGNMMGSWMERELMPRDVFGTPASYSFESLTIYGPEDYDTYLTGLYGNWRELPPVEKRKSHHDFLMMDLEHSYLENESIDRQPQCHEQYHQHGENTVVLFSRVYP